MNIKDIKELLKSPVITEDTKIYVARDEEWNVVYSDVRAVYDDKENSIVLYGLTGSETEDWLDGVRD